MRDLARPLLILTVVLAIPIAPFLLWGETLESKITRWTQETEDRTAAALAIGGVLAADVFLPVPSSLVSTLGGAKLGLVGGTLVSWLGMTVGAALGFAAARLGGTPLTRRLAGDEELARMTKLAERFGVQTLVFTRPLPVLAEATVLLLGASGLSWRRVAAPLALSNLGIAAAYSAAGRFAMQRQALPLALVLSVAIPVTATALARWWWPQGDSTE